MMTGMNVGQMTKYTGSSVAVAARCLRRPEVLRADMEVAVKRMLEGLLAVALVAAVVVGLGLASERLGARTVPRTGRDPKPSVGFGHVPVSRDAGMMPEVVVTAEMPRLVMPTVEVSAFRTMAVSGTVSNVY